MQIEINILKFKIEPYEDDDFLGYLIRYGLKFDDHLMCAPISIHLSSEKDAIQACLMWVKIGCPNEITSKNTVSPWSFELLKKASENNLRFDPLEYVNIDEINKKLN